MQSVVQDFRYAVRGLLGTPAFTITAVVSLALAIGASTVIFSAVDAVLLRPLSYLEPDRLTWIWENNQSASIKQEPPSYPDFSDWQDQSKSFEGFGAFAAFAPILTNAGEPERISGYLVSPGLFTLLRAQPLVGRSFDSDDDRSGKTSVAIVGESLWRRRFGARPGIIGESITLNETLYQIVGVMPASFEFPNPGSNDTAEIWAPLPATLKAQNRRTDFLSVIGRLNASTSLAAARSEMDTIANRLEGQYPGTNKGWGVSIVPLYERFTGDTKPAMLVLSFAVGFLFLIACANIANLLLVRGVARRRDSALRKALGASRWRIVRQYFAESLTLALAGGIAGGGLAFIGVYGLRAFAPKDIPRLGNSGIDIRTLGFCIAASVATALISGLGPAVQASGTDLNEELKEGGRSSTAGSAARRARELLLTVEVAMALSLLIAAVLLIRSFMNLQSVEPGFQPRGILTVQIILPKQKYKTPDQVALFTKTVLSNLRSMPGSEDAAVASTIPLSGNSSVRDFVIKGRPPLPAGELNDAEYQVVSPTFFHTFNIPLLQGRLFTDDDGAHSEPAAIISDRFATKYFPGEDPIGRQLMLGDSEPGAWITIVGVVGNIRQSELGLEPYPQLYANFEQDPQWGSALAIKSHTNPASIIEQVRGQIASVDPDQPLFHVKTMPQVMAESLSRQRFSTQLMTLLTAIALGLTIVGIYGVVSYIAAQRVTEIGIRMALGAENARIILMMLWQGLRLALMGIAVGVAGAFALTRLMIGLLYGIGASDPATFIAVSLIVAGTAMAASYIPARRAARIEPVAALRHE